MLKRLEMPKMGLDFVDLKVVNFIFGKDIFLVSEVLNKIKNYGDMYVENIDPVSNGIGRVKALVEIYDTRATDYPVHGEKIGRDTKEFIEFAENVLINPSSFVVCDGIANYTHHTNVNKFGSLLNMKDRPVQFFISTQSIDMVHSLLDAMDNEEDVMFYRIDNNGGKNEVVTVNLEEFDIMCRHGFHFI